MRNCMCDDTYCPECGAAQGYDKKTEQFYNDIYAKFPWLKHLEAHTGHNPDELIKVIADLSYAKGYQKAITQTLMRK